MPLPGAEVSLIRVDAESFRTNSDDTCNAVLTPSVRYLVRAKHVLSELGEVDGEEYSEKRYYCTMVLELGGDLSEVETQAPQQPVEKNISNVKLERVDAQIEDFPRGMTSFGATVMGNKLFVTGGKSGRAHSYARSYQNGDVYCLDFESKKWETVGQTLGLQGWQSLIMVVRSFVLAAWKLVTKKAKSTNCGRLQMSKPSIQKLKNGLSGLHCRKADHRLMLVSIKAKFTLWVVGRWRSAKTLNGHRTC